MGVGMSDRFVPFYVIVCGGRDFRDRNAMNVALDKIATECDSISALIHGNASGADTLRRRGRCRLP